MGVFSNAHHSRADGPISRRVFGGKEVLEILTILLTCVITTLVQKVLDHALDAAANRALSK